MGEDVQTYVQSYLIYKLNKTKKKKIARLLQSLPILKRLWENILMEFIGGFPKVGKFKFIFMIVDKFSKYVIFIPAVHACPAKETTKLFFNHVVKYFGLPKNIFSNWDAQFTSQFWTKLFKLSG